MELHDRFIIGFLHKLLTHVATPSKTTAWGAIVALLMCLCGLKLIY